MDKATEAAGARRLAVAVMAVTLALPVFLAVAVLPTPMGDLREQIVWGRFFPLVTPNHPPAMAWASGLIDLLFGPALVPQIIGGQVAFMIGAAYVYATLRLVTVRGTAFLFLFLYATGIYVVVGPASWVLNADTLQALSWPPAAYHFIVAARSDRWRHWLALGAWAALAMLTKYTAVLLFAAMAAAALIVPEFRRVLRRPGPYVAVAVAAALLLPHAIAVLNSPAALQYGTARFAPQSLGQKLRSVAEVAVGYLFMLAPGWVLVPIGLRRGDLVLRRPAENPAEWPPARRFVLYVNGAIVAMSIGLIAFGNLVFISRFAIPFAGIAMPALALFVRWGEGRRAAGERRLAWAVGALNILIVVGASIIYLGFSSHRRMQEPYPGPSEAIMAEWRARFACGPAYVTGLPYSAYLLAIHAGRDVTGLAMHNFGGVPWFDAEKLDRLGAVVVDSKPIAAADLPPILRPETLTEERVMIWPLLRTRSGETITYHYRFMPPRACPAAGK